MVIVWEFFVFWLFLRVNKDGLISCELGFFFGWVVVYFCISLSSWGILGKFDFYKNVMYSADIYLKGVLVRFVFDFN